MFRGGSSSTFNYCDAIDPSSFCYTFIKGLPYFLTTFSPFFLQFHKYLYTCSQVSPVIALNFSISFLTHLLFVWLKYLFIMLLCCEVLMQSLVAVLFRSLRGLFFFLFRAKGYFSICYSSWECSGKQTCSSTFIFIK